MLHVIDVTHSECVALIVRPWESGFVLVYSNSALVIVLLELANTGALMRVSPTPKPPVRCGEHLSTWTIGQMTGHGLEITLRTAAWHRLRRVHS